jgi:hypothetical protein
MSLLGSEMTIRGHIYKPFYILLGVFFFSGLLVFLGIVYSYLYIKFTLVKYINKAKQERDRYIKSN